MKLLKSLFFISIVILLHACSSGRNYTSQDPDLYKVKTIAILPVKVVYSGNIPKKITKSQLDSIATEEGLFFQKSLNNNLLSRSGGKGRIVGVSYQAIEKTNNILLNSEYKLNNFYSADPDVLAKLLGVDAVLKMEVNSNKIMSDLTSLGIDLLKEILGNNNVNLGNVLGSASNQKRTADINTYATLIYNGKTLWNSRYQSETDWQENMKVTVDYITAAMGRNFPY